MAMCGGPLEACRHPTLSTVVEPPQQDGTTTGQPLRNLAYVRQSNATFTVLCHRLGLVLAVQLHSTRMRQQTLFQWQSYVARPCALSILCSCPNAVASESIAGLGVLLPLRGRSVVDRVRRPRGRPATGSSAMGRPCRLLRSCGFLPWLLAKTATAEAKRKASLPVPSTASVTLHMDTPAPQCMQQATSLERYSCSAPAGRGEVHVMRAGCAGVLPLSPALGGVHGWALHLARSPAAALAAVGGASAAALPLLLVGCTVCTMHRYMVLAPDLEPEPS